MKWVDNVELYLRLKMDLRGKKPYSIDLLQKYPESMECLREYALLAHSIISGQSMTINGKTSCKLTACSIAIGKRILSTLASPWAHDWKDHVRIGDLMIETFYQLGMVDVITPKFKSIKPVEVVLTDLWPTEIPEEMVRMTLNGVWDTRPRDIYRLEQVIQFKDGLKSSRPVIKRWDETLDGPFRELLKTPAISAVNKLQQVGWCINQAVLDAVLKRPDKFYNEGDNSDENKSKIIDYRYITTKAKALSEVDEFFYALDMDYRGRIYYVESYMNFQGSDLARGLLLFSEKRVVTLRGYHWMKIHAASSFNQSYTRDDIPTWCSEDYASHLEKEQLDDISVDKWTLLDRAAWVDNNLDLILETAANGTLHNCEKPVAFLAVCIEIANYLQSDGNYMSSLPVPIDGSNNGWQHLGAISKDEQTGALVGLVPVVIQNDFYVQTAKKLIEITKDEERLRILNSMPMKAIRKYISKRGSMTRAYSAGAQKIAENMYNDCKTGGIVGKYGITEDHCKGFARDLVKAIELVCPGPLKTMKFLQQLAQDRIGQGYTFLKWETPSGFPVVYTCNHVRSEKLRVRMRGIGQINHVAKVETDNPDMRGFMCGISPNYIHSQDASHMSLVINQFNQPFGAVHDSFSTFASDVDELCTLTKQVFIDMYDKDNYFDIIQQRLEATAEQPPLGSLRVDNIEYSDYFFA